MVFINFCKFAVEWFVLTVIMLAFKGISPPSKLEISFVPQKTSLGDCPRKSINDALNSAKSDFADLDRYDRYDRLD